MRNWLAPTPISGGGSVGLFAVRLVTGLAFILHGLPKVTREGEIVLLNWMGPESPVPGVLQAAAAIIEVVGGGMILIGVLTPVAALLLALVMVVAIGLVHLPAGHPFVAPGKPNYELAAVYLAVCVQLLLIGPGLFSLDALLFSRSASLGKSAGETRK